MRTTISWSIKRLDAPFTTEGLGDHPCACPASLGFVITLRGSITRLWARPTASARRVDGRRQRTHVEGAARVRQSTREERR